MLKVKNLLRLLKSDATVNDIKNTRTYLKYLWLDAGFSAVFLYRIQSMFTDLGLVPLAKLVRRLNISRNSFDAAIGSKIGESFVVPHPAGIVIGNKFIAGNNLILMPHVVIGQKSFKSQENNSENPVVGDNVKIGAGALILGSIEIGSDCVIGAGTIVLQNVAPSCYVFGNPNQTRVLSLNDSNAN